MKRPQVRWLDRFVGLAGPYLALCLTPAEFQAALAVMGVVRPWPEFVLGRAAATTHFYENPKGDLVALVNLGAHPDLSGVEVAALLVHESVHIWQHYLEDIRERHPGSELEAYGIQAISQTLMLEYARRIENGDLCEISRSWQSAGDGDRNDSGRQGQAHAAKGLAQPRREAPHRAVQGQGVSPVRGNSGPQKEEVAVSSIAL